MGNNEISKGVERAGLVSSSGVSDWVRSWDVLWTCEKWTEEACDFARSKFGLDKNAPVSSAMLRPIATPDLGVDYVNGNLLLNAGITRILNLLIGSGAQALDATHARVGVGNGTTAATAADTDLSAAAGSSNRQWVTMNATFPSVSAQTVTYQSDFTTGLANFHWQEWGIDQGVANGTTVTAVMLNHKVEDLGTKTTGTWTLSGAITIS